MNKKALVIEDDKSIAELLRLYLEKDGFEVSIAPDGGKGLQLAGVSVEAGYPEAFEMEGHPFYIAVVYHPEYISRPGRPHPLFVRLVQRGLERAHA